MGAVMLLAPLSLSAQFGGGTGMASEWRARDDDKKDKKDKKHSEHDREEHGDDRDDDRDNVRNAGYQNGYNDGYEQGRYDRSNNRNSSGQVRGNNDTRGYNKSMGPKGQYKKSYRQGFARGYEDGYGGRNSDWGGWGDGRRREDRDDRNDRNGRGRYGSELQRIAEQNGYADGQWYAQREPNSNPTNTKGYRDADRGYSSSLGSKSEFQNFYRAAFVEGFNSRGNGGYGRGDGRYGSELERIAERNGNDDGVWYAQREPNSNATETKGYRDADRGYTSSLGSKSEFQRIYRAAFVQGFNSRGRGGIGGVLDGIFNPNSRDNRGGSTLQVQAESRGYASGVFYAQKDMREGNRANPSGAKGYQDADDGYSSSLGSKDEYQRIFRSAFIEGYNRTYR